MSFRKSHAIRKTGRLKREVYASVMPLTLNRAEYTAEYGAEYRDGPVPAALRFPENRA